jgi:hypothetical protein
MAGDAPRRRRRPRGRRNARKTGTVVDTVMASHVGPAHPCGAGPGAKEDAAAAQPSPPLPLGAGGALESDIDDEWADSVATAVPVLESSPIELMDDPGGRSLLLSGLTAAGPSGNGGSVVSFRDDGGVELWGKFMGVNEDGAVLVKVLGGKLFTVAAKDIRQVAPPVGR